jgi:hypothetical protein
MTFPSRRGFLAGSFGAIAAGHAFGAEVISSTGPATTRSAADDLPAGLVKVPEDPAFQPSTLFLTWHRDPTTTMVVQWVGTAGETADTTVYYSPAATALTGASAPIGSSVLINPWRSERPATRKYPMTDFTVYRPS